MKIETIVGGNLESNGYIIYDLNGKEGYIIDPGYNPDRFIKFINEKNIKLLGILLTHHHYDHIGAVDKIRSFTGCKVFIHINDADMLKKDVDVMLENGHKFILGDETIEVIHTPGHTRGSVCFYCCKSRIAFTGDTIFNVDLGRTDLEDGSEREMVKSIREIISKWENDIRVYPGHGDSANMKYVRKNNFEFINIMGN